MMSSLYIGATGLKNQAEGIGVISNNLANANTIAYKQMSMEYSDLMSQYLSSPSNTLTNMSQKGAGSAISAIRTKFTQGSFESSSSSTDIGINGIGFFAVTDGTKVHYTRAGNFHYNETGALLDPSGWALMGNSIKNGVASITVEPIRVDTSANGQGVMAAKATSKISVGSRLGGIKDNSGDVTNPMFALASSYNGSHGTALASSAYSYSEPIQFYDSKGDLRTATIYYDKAGENGGLTAIEYVVAINPLEDASPLAGTNASGLLLAGTITFSSSGEMTNLTAFYPPASGDPSDLSGWTPAALANGQPVLAIQSKGVDAQNIVLDMGFTFTGVGASAGGGAASAADLAANPGLVYRVEAAKELGKNASDMYGSSSSSLYLSKDGYTFGVLQNTSITSDGILRGEYSNGQTSDLYRIALYRFSSQDGLCNEGNNHYSATLESGVAEAGIPGTENFGTLSGGALEQSNVDYAREFSQLIITQRGFQMNSKIITTSDSMLQKALELKR